MICRGNNAYKTKSVKILLMMSTKHTVELVNTGKLIFNQNRMYWNLMELFDTTLQWEA